MNDCFWFWCKACGCTGICVCDKYLSINCQKGRELLLKYEEEIQEAIKSIKEKYQKLMIE